MRVLNLVGGPGSGKSTTRAGLFHYMKLAGFRVEETVEYAKELVFEESRVLLANQEHVTAEQDRRLRRLIGKVDYALTDSPLLLGSIYGTGIFAEPWFKDKCETLYESYDNVLIYIERVKPYAPYGRSQTEDEARAIDSRVRRLYGDRIDLFVPGDAQAPQRIMQFLDLGG